MSFTQKVGYKQLDPNTPQWSIKPVKDGVVIYSEVNEQLHLFFRETTPRVYKTVANVVSFLVFLIGYPKSAELFVGFYDKNDNLTPRWIQVTEVPEYNYKLVRNGN